MHISPQHSRHSQVSRPWARTKGARGARLRSAIPLLILCVVLLGCYQFMWKRSPLHAFHRKPATSAQVDAAGHEPVRSLDLHKPKRPQLLLPVWWHAPFFDQSSFGTEAAGLMLSLLDSELIDPKKAWISPLQMSCRDSLGNTSDPDVNAVLHGLQLNIEKTQPAIVVCHNMPLFYGLPEPAWRSCAPCPPKNYKPAWTIARAMAETDQVPADFVRAMNSLDEVWVPSDWSLKVLTNSGVHRNKIHIVPLTTNTSWFTRTKHKSIDLEAIPPLLPLKKVYGLPDNPARRGKLWSFLSVFKWEDRKGWDVLLSAYLNEFSFKDKVVLYILTRPYDSVPDIQAAIKQWAAEHITTPVLMLPRLYIITEHLNVSTYARLLASTDAFVLPTRGEGWGLPLVEAMSMEMPVIATNCAGMTAYLDDQVGYPIGYTQVPVPNNVGQSWFKGSSWSEPNVGQLQVAMRTVVLNKATAFAKGKAARERILDRYAPNVISQKLFQEFRRIERIVAKQKLGIPYNEPIIH